RRNACKRERNERVVARERQTQKTPGGLVAAHQGDRFELVEKPARRAEIAERARAFLRPRPPFPSDAGMINAEAGVPEHAERDGDEGRDQDLARGTDLIAHEHRERERDREVIGVALLEAKRARLQAQPILQDQGAQDVAAPTAAIAIAADATGRDRIVLIVISLM